MLDALLWIQLHRDPSLTMRHSWLHASCGTCGMQVDGREELACVCSVHDHGAEIVVEPLANLPILTDLVVEMNGFFAPLSPMSTRSSARASSRRTLSTAIS